uniref:Reverse transcriptase domain-containing protein n=1 Tax=Lactuca sativa TaxID=4236 RepID=A0A9R1VY83_LACSA|nr:hypothetical protein LSAT_V11C400224590 [Lactuca sativa]
MEAGLHDIKIRRNRFTYCCKTDLKLSKLDRFLVCDNFLNLFPSASLIALPRELSDHCLITLQTSLPDFGKPPFRFFNSWMLRDGIDDIVKKAWANFKGFITHATYMKSKLKFLKNKIKKWRAVDHPKEMQELQQSKARMQELDLAAKTQDLNDSEIKERWPSRPKLTNPNFSTLDPAANTRLEAPIVIDEIKSAIWDCGSEKAPGPDEYSFKLFKTYWDMLKTDKIKVAKHFERFGRFEIGCNASFLTLLSEIKDPLSIGDFRPIYLIGSMYKIIAKILAKRLKCVIGQCIGDVQTAFVEGRNILDGLLIINELCSWAKKQSDKILFFKVDFNKEFYMVNWEYLDHIQMQMGFGERWRGWIQGYLKSSRASVLVNGTPTDEFDFERGIRQGDPLSPFLFIIVMEGLHISMKGACEKGIFKGWQIPNDDCSVSHLFYANDALFVRVWSAENLKNLERILRCFHVSSGLRVNFNNSRVFGIGVEPHEIATLAEPLGCEPTKLPFIYLGVPVGGKHDAHKALASCD